MKRMMSNRFHENFSLIEDQQHLGRVCAEVGASQRAKSAATHRMRNRGRMLIKLRRQVAEAD
jgi:hypothetical protein